MNIEAYKSIPGNIVGYWISKQMIDNFKYQSLAHYATASVGMISGDNDRFLRLWFEVSLQNSCFDATDYLFAVYTGKKWFPLQKGGEKRYWYGNLEYVINYEKDGFELKFKNSDANGRTRSHNYNGPRAFQPGITWNSIGSQDLMTRISTGGFIYDAAGPLCEINSQSDTNYFLGLMFSKPAKKIYQFINPTLNYTPGTLLSLPVIFPTKERKEYVTEIVKENIDTAHSDWDSFETSWNFKKHPLA